MSEPGTSQRVEPPEQPRPVRQRARRGSLNRTRIAGSALELVDAAGIQALTMPRLAAHLGVGTMSLYRHVTGKADLLNAMVDMVFRDLDVPDGAPNDWQHRVVDYLLHWRASAKAHPAMAGLLAQRGLSFPAARGHLRELLSTFRAAGFQEEASVRAFYTLYIYVSGFVLWELQSTDTPGHTEPSESLAGADPQSVRRPAESPMEAALATRRSEAQFRYGLDRIVEALEHGSRLGS